MFASPFPSPHHDHGLCVTEALATAASLCTGRGARLTAIRRRVLELIWGSHGPVGAYHLLDTLNREGGNAKPPTVYRALEFLLAQGLIHRIEHLNAYVGCTRPDRPHAGLFLVCDHCHSTAEIDAPELNSALDRSAAAAAFTVRRTVIEIDGLCAHCRDAANV